VYRYDSHGDNWFRRRDLEPLEFLATPALDVDQAVGLSRHAIDGTGPDRYLGCHPDARAAAPAPKHSAEGHDHVRNRGQKASSA
jgi:hypothetical protein